MMGWRLIIRVWLALLVACPVAATAFDYRDLTNQFAHPPSHSERNGISLDEAVSRVRRQSGGKILSAETVHVDGRRVHRVKVLTTNGRVTLVDIDADTGRPASRGR